jgi:hypothetical protein
MLFSHPCSIVRGDYAVVSVEGLMQPSLFDRDGHVATLPLRWGHGCAARPSLSLS